MSGKYGAGFNGKLRRAGVAIPIAAISFYRKAISPLFPPVCRFTPTCSEYALEAYRTRGFVAGSILTCWRILRCNPFCKSGYDPVPPPGSWSPHVVEYEDGAEHAAECDGKAWRADGSQAGGCSGCGTAGHGMDDPPKRENEG